MKLQSLLIVALMVLSAVTLGGCTITGVKDSLQGALETIKEKDTAFQNRDSIDLTTAPYTDYYYPETGVVRLQGAGLTQIPDLCMLIPNESHIDVLVINLSANEIKTFDQDLSCFTNLEELNLSYNGATDLVALGDLPNLKTLKLHKNELTTTATIASAGSFPMLEDLNVGYNQLTELVGIDSFTNLVSLEAYHNQLESLVGVERLEQLDSLKVEFNKLTSGDVEQLLETRAIEFITAKGNSITDSLLERLAESNNSYIENLREQMDIENLIRQGAQVFEINADGQVVDQDGNVVDLQE